MLTCIRNNEITLLIEGRLIKYLLYRSGEVLLIAIGIMAELISTETAFDTNGEEKDRTFVCRMANFWLSEEASN